VRRRPPLHPSAAADSRWREDTAPHRWRHIQSRHLDPSVPASYPLWTVQLDGLDCANKSQAASRPCA